MENYMVHVRVLADKRIDDMEKTMSILAEQVARLECELNNLESIDGDNVCDKVRKNNFQFRILMFFYEYLKHFYFSYLNYKSMKIFELNIIVHRSYYFYNCFQ
jgi:hypothetical protein